jgi:hypothetical protein
MKAHRIMTPEEWHMVCKDYDGPGGIGIRYIGVAAQRCLNGKHLYEADKDGHPYCIDCGKYAYGQEPASLNIHNPGGD